jgi:hypothetical protein
MAALFFGSGPLIWLEDFEMKAAPPEEPLQLYFIQADGTPPFIKIGVSRNVRRRITDLQLGCPYRLRLLKRSFFPGMERALHKRFADDRETGEWFRVTDELLAVIAGMEGESLLEAYTYRGGSMVYAPSSSADQLFVDKRDRNALAAIRKRPYIEMPDDPFEWVPAITEHRARIAKQQEGA